MAQTEITYPDKVTGNQFTGAEATEVKSVVNANAQDAQSQLDQKTDIPSLILTFDGNGNTSGTVPEDMKIGKNHSVLLPDGDGLIKGATSVVSWNSQADGLGDSYDNDDLGSFSASTTLFAIYGAPMVATGGVITDLNGYRYHEFLSDSNFEVVSDPADIELLIVGGGGSGGYGYAGGGGGGGVRQLSTTPTVGVYPIVVGDGGLGTLGSNRGSSGEDSTAFGFSASGGGGGGSLEGANKDGIDGGSGGGGGPLGVGGAGDIGSYTPDEGRNGGNGGSTTNNYPGGGGGGAGAIGDAGSGSFVAGDGGDGITVWGNDYGGGGGGSTFSGGSFGVGGIGGGGSGGNGIEVDCEAGDANTGGGSGGGGFISGGGGIDSLDGGSGIVIIRYPI